MDPMWILIIVLLVFGLSGDDDKSKSDYNPDDYEYMDYDRLRDDHE